MIRIRWWRALGVGGGVAVVAALGVPAWAERRRRHDDEAAAIGALKTIRSSGPLREDEGPLDHGDIEELADARLIDGLLRSPMRSDCTFGPADCSSAGGPADEPWRSTRSTDLETPSYTVLRQSLAQRALPAPASVRIEELIDAFDYGYAPPLDGDPRPFAVHAAATACPWDAGSRLLRVALSGREVDGARATIAEDVMIHVAWDPVRVRAIRRVGHEDRLLADRDLADDTEDGGELGAGHTVTALYVVQLRDGVPPSGSLGALELRWKDPGANISQHTVHALDDDGSRFEAAPADLRFAASVAAFGMLLRGSEHSGTATFAWCRRTAEGARGDDPRRAELVDLIRAAEALTADERLPARSP